MGDEPKSQSWNVRGAPAHAAASAGGDATELAALLAPALIEACDGRLSPPEWFRSTWQSGGAATAFATYRFDSGETVPVVVKLPVGPAEYRWTVSLGLSDGAGTIGYLCPMGPTPCVLAAGTELGGYDLAWLVVERLAGSPLNRNICRDSIEGLLAAAADWYERSLRLLPVPANSRGKVEDWDHLVTRAREVVREGLLPSIADERRWAEALRQTHKHIGHLVDAWESRPINTWCHGDLHPGNAMRRWDPAADNSRSRTPGGSTGVVLIDLALVHPGHWVEDAVYLERLFWGRAERLDGVKPVSFLARAIRDRGLETREDYTRLANIRRTLMAATAPAFLGGEGNPKYVHGALEMLEKTLPLALR